MDRSTQIAVAKLNVEKSRQTVQESRSKRTPALDVGPVATYLHRSPVLPEAVVPRAFISGSGAGIQASLDTKVFELPKLNKIVRRSSLQTEAAQLGLEMAERNVTFNVMKSYYDVLFDQRSLMQSKASQAAAKEHLQEAEELFKEGKVARYDVMRAQVRLANTQPQIIENTRLLDQDEQTLARLAGLDVSQTFNVVGTLDRPMESFNYETLLANAYRRRLDLRKLVLSQKIQKLNVGIEGARDPVSFAVNGQYVHYWLREGGRPFPLSTYYFDVSLNIPLTGASHVHLRRQAELQAETIGKQIEDLRTTIATELMRDLSKLKESRDILGVQGANVKLAEESLRVGELSYRNGKATSLDVEDSRQNLLQARTAYLQADHDYAIGVLKIRRAAGLPLHPPQSSP